MASDFAATKFAATRETDGLICVDCACGTQGWIPSVAAYGELKNTYATVTFIFRCPSCKKQWGKLGPTKIGKVVA